MQSEAAEPASASEPDASWYTHCSAGRGDRSKAGLEADAPAATVLDAAEPEPDIWFSRFLGGTARPCVQIAEVRPPMMRAKAPARTTTTERSRQRSPRSVSVALSESAPRITGASCGERPPGRERSLAHAFPFSSRLPAEREAAACVVLGLGALSARRQAASSSPVAGPFGPCLVRTAPQPATCPSPGADVAVRWQGAGPVPLADVA
jgi:hypothetical protein